MSPVRAAAAAVWAARDYLPWAEVEAARQALGLPADDVAAIWAAAVAEARARQPLPAQPA